MLVVNMYGGPGSGKSTMAADLFQCLKREGINCELVTEWCKDKVWEGNKKIFQDQIYIFGKQHWKQLRMKGEVDVIITDSPLLLSLVYNDMNTGEGYLEELEPLVLEAFHKFHNLNVYVERDKPYNPKGRNQTEEEARGIDLSIKGMLKWHDIPYISVSGSSRAESGLVDIVKSHLGQVASLDSDGKILTSQLPQAQWVPVTLTVADVKEQVTDILKNLGANPQVPVTFSTNLTSWGGITSEGEFRKELGTVLEKFHRSPWDSQTRDQVQVAVRRFCREAFDTPSDWSVEWVNREFKLGFLTMPDMVLEIRTSRKAMGLPQWAREMEPIIISFKKQ